MLTDKRTLPSRERSGRNRRWGFVGIGDALHAMASRALRGGDHFPLPNLPASRRQSSAVWRNTDVPRSDFIWRRQLPQIGARGGDTWRGDKKGQNGNY